MESLNIFMTAREELRNMRKSLGTDSMVIDFKNMDEVTRGEIVSSLSKAISKRSKELDNMITGVNK